MNKLCAHPPPACPRQKKQNPVGGNATRLSICSPAAAPQNSTFSARLNASLSARFLDPAENRQKSFASVPLDLLSFLGTGPQTTNDDIIDLPK